MVPAVYLHIHTPFPVLRSLSASHHKHYPPSPISTLVQSSLVHGRKPTHTKILHRYPFSLLVLQSYKHATPTITLLTVPTFLRPIRPSPSCHRRRTCIGQLEPLLLPEFLFFIPHFIIYFPGCPYRSARNGLAEYCSTSPSVVSHPHHFCTTIQTPPPHPLLPSIPSHSKVVVLPCLTSLPKLLSLLHPLPSHLLKTSASVTVTHPVL